MESYNNWVIVAVAIFVVMIGVPLIVIYRKPKLEEQIELVPEEVSPVHV